MASKLGPKKQLHSNSKVIDKCPLNSLQGSQIETAVVQRKDVNASRESAMIKRPVRILVQPGAVRGDLEQQKLDNAKAKRQPTSPSQAAILTTGKGNVNDRIFRIGRKENIIDNKEPTTLRAHVGVISRKRPHVIHMDENEVDGFTDEVGIRSQPPRTVARAMEFDPEDCSTSRLSIGNQPPNQGLESQWVDNIHEDEDITRHETRSARMVEKPSQLEALPPEAEMMIGRRKRQTRNDVCVRNGVTNHMNRSPIMHDHVARTGEPSSLREDVGVISRRRPNVVCREENEVDGFADEVEIRSQPPRTVEKPTSIPIMHDHVARTGGDAIEEMVEKRRRGKGNCENLIPEPGKRWKVEWDDEGCAVGAAAEKLNKCISAISKQGEIWPIDITWPQMDYTSFIDSWKLIIGHFDLGGHPNAWTYCFEHLHDRWRTWKSELKRRCYLPYDTDEARLEHLDDLVDPRKWAKLIKTWSTQKSKDISTQNKINRSLKKMNHRTGARSFPNVKRKLEKKTWS